MPEYRLLINLYYSAPGACMVFGGISEICSDRDIKVEDELRFRRIVVEPVQVRGYEAASG